MTRYAHVTGWGMSVPSKVLTNLDIAQMVDTDDEWIRTRTGIHERRIAEKDQTTTSLAVEAAFQALEVANMKPADVELVVVATSSPENIFPATACLVQDQIGATKAGAFDLSAACTGFIFALNMAAQAIRSGSINNALVIGTETLSRVLNWSDRETCILFGDGAGAFVLQASDQPGGLLSAVMHSDGSGGEMLSLPASGEPFTPGVDPSRNGRHYIRMNGREVFRFATRVMSQATREAVERAGLKLENIQWLIPHQANRRIIEAAAKNLNIPLEQCTITLDRYGNTSTSSIPIAACEAVKDGRLKSGDKIVIVAFGAGLTWGAAVLEWGSPPPRRRRWLITGYLRLWARCRSALLRVARKLEGWIWDRN